MDFKARKYPNWIASKTMVERSDLSGDEKWILTVLIAALVASKRYGAKSINPTLSGVAKSIGRSLEEVLPDFQDLMSREFIAYDRKGEIRCIHIENLEKEGVIDPGSIPNV